jgi:hypothetical protein
VLVGLAVASYIDATANTEKNFHDMNGLQGTDQELSHLYIAERREGYQRSQRNKKQP